MKNPSAPKVDTTVYLRFVVEFKKSKYLLYWERLIGNIFTLGDSCDQNLNHITSRKVIDSFYSDENSNTSVFFLVMSFITMSETKKTFKDTYHRWFNALNGPLAFVVVVFPITGVYFANIDSRVHSIVKYLKYIAAIEM